jgi:hypothetical protein
MTTLSKTSFRMTTLRIIVIKRNTIISAKYDTQHNNKKRDTQHNGTRYCYSERRLYWVSQKARYNECRLAECHDGGCHDNQHNDTICSVSFLMSVVFMSTVLNVVVPWRGSCLFLYVYLFNGSCVPLFKRFVASNTRQETLCKCWCRCRCWKPLHLPSIIGRRLCQYDMIVYRKINVITLCLISAIK